ncbi:methyl-accepting chemotaxis protein [Pseudooceanicola onchidii]|uniref:methyl-accepting chemotaxis protein n=1 Tax=Pseudooceanicola onchidii TaxID=2562279 RepID=UPI0010AB161D|nr:PAS domain-containing methyl-accepting chemotaxis protein [Pseudooceanicola onchidii]
MLRSLSRDTRRGAHKASEEEQKRNDALVQMVMSTQAVIHFAPDATILFANDNFLGAMGFSDVSEIQGQKHAIFVEPDFAESAEYATFWDLLRNGQPHTDVFKRLRRDGSEIWIDATYAPVFDASGKVARVIKVARDITDRHLMNSLLFQGLDNLRDGDLTPATFDDRYDVVRKLGLRFNEMVTSMADFVRKVRMTSTSAHGIASQLDAATDDLAQRGESQAASLEQVAAAINELSASAESSVQRARESHDLAKSSQESAEDGRKVVDSVKGAMNEIEASSTQIGHILSSIDEIAFQTNLLALNAGVEAARAGDAGRGFAVVASEVRSLAQRASDAATEIKLLVKSSDERVKNGSKLVARADEVLQRIFEEIGTISQNVASNMTTLDEQAMTISEINMATTKLSTDTERNAANIRSAADMSRTLKGEADGLMHEVSRFRTGDEGRDNVGLRMVS